MSLPTLQPELRALELFDVVPAGHFALLVRDDRFEPHLNPGELAIVDTTDEERVRGELYVINLLGPPGSVQSKPRLRIVEYEYDCEVGIWFAFGLKRDLRIGGLRYRYHDGPLGFQHWPAYCQGRVIGVMMAS